MDDAFKSNLGASEMPAFATTSLLDMTCLYRAQSHTRFEPSSLQGVVVEWPNTLSSERVNEVLMNGPRWQGRSLVNLRVIVVKQRTGAFEANADALYYNRNMRVVEGISQGSDLLDISKLNTIYTERLPLIASILVPDSFKWLTNFLKPLEPAAINEYMCHEGGHRLGYDTRRVSDWPRRDHAVRDRP